MNKRRIVMMISVLFITILVASGFYVLTGEANSGLITINRTQTDYEKVPDENGPYGTEGNKYYIRYTGALSGRTVVDLEDTNVVKNGENLGGCGLTIKNGYPYIFGQKITSTYKMFSDNDDLYRVFIPSSIAFADTDTSLSAKYKGIQKNTFDGNSQVIDCIYRTPKLSKIDARGSGLAETGSSGNLVYDKTGITYDNASNVTTYVCLDNNNVSRSNISITDSGSLYSYNGYIKNVYVDKSVNDVVCLFDICNSGTEINSVLMDEDGEWTDLSYMFHCQTFITLSSHFKFNNKAENLCRIFRLTKLKELPDSFSLPDSVTSTFDMFARCYTLNKIPSNFTLPKNLITASGTFYWCSSLSEFPNDFRIPEGVKNAEAIFHECQNLSTVITIPYTVTNLSGMLYNAGTNIDVSTNECPIILKCSDPENPSIAYLEYKSNIKGLDDNGRVYKKLYAWEAIYDNGGPYETDFQDADNNMLGTFKKIKKNYYIHYRGNSSVVDLGKSDTDNKLTVNNGTTKIFGVEVTNTYKMFAKNNSYDSNDKLYRVFIPSSIAFNTSGGIQANTFTGTSQEIDCIYRTPKLNTIDARGSGLTSTYDKTGIITQQNVTTYVALDNNNIDRSNAIANQTDTYTGGIQNVFVTNEVTNLVSLFMKNYWNGTSNVNIPETTEIKAVLLDDNPNENWTNIYRMFGGQTFKTLPSRFRLPETVVLCNTVFVLCEQLESLPEGFTVPSHAVSITNLFARCHNLKSLPSTFTIPNTITSMTQTFQYCEKLSGIITIPSSVSGFYATFEDTGISVSTSNKITYGGKQYSIIVKCGSQAVYDAFTEVDGVLHKVLDTSTQSLDNQSQPVVVDDYVDSDEVSDTNSTDRSSTESSQTMVAKDETEWVTVTVNKKSVDEVVEETQTNSQSVENGEESKSDEDDIQE